MDIQDTNCKWREILSILVVSLLEQEVTILKTVSGGIWGLSLYVISAVHWSFDVEICVDQPKDRLPKIVITFDLVLGLCYRIWCEYFSACCINQHKKYTQDCMLDRKMYSNLREINSAAGEIINSLQLCSLGIMFVRQDHKNCMFHKDCLSQSTNPILNQVGGYDR